MISLVSKRIRRCAAVFLVMLLAAAYCMTALAAEEEEQPRVLRVAFPEVKGITETAEDGSRHGLVVDYLKEIAKYTGWEYEYVDTDGDTMIQEFLDGEYDLMGGNYYSEGFEEYFAYPDYNTGYSKSVLLARGDDFRIHSYDLESMNGKTIGVYDRAVENIRRLKEFLAINGLDCTLKYYSYEQLSNTGNLYPFLENGEVDLLLGNSIESGGGARVAVSFDSQPYYIVTNVGNQEVLDGLNMALERILDSNPDFGEECYAANFPERISVDIQLNGDDLAYVEQKGTITVAVTNSWHPMFCLNSDDELHDGIVPDILSQIADFTGLQFSYVYADTYADAIDLVRRGDADIMGFFLDADEDAADNGLVLSSSYMNLNSIIVRNKSVTYPSENLTAAVIVGRHLPSDIVASEVLTFDNMTEALAAVSRGKADFAYGISAHMEQEIQRHYYNNLVPVALDNNHGSLSFAMKCPADPELLTVLNKAINSLSGDERDIIKNRNLVSMGVASLPLTELIYARPVLFITILSLIILAVSAMVVWINHSRMKAAVMRSNLEKAQAESRAKGEFLSRMSHEIRTPMNAVVGLADLTDMMTGVPENVRDNLRKIRSSSRYLLELINDILDMSRIDSGMLSIASEPFSMELMIGKLQSMMESEAQRRGLEFTLEKEIVHSSLTGDAIRLQQVLTNLLSNAFKFTSIGGKVRLSVVETGSTEESAVFTFRVKDNGVGIPVEDQKRIFESFEQLGTNHSKSQGTGLGLPISSSIVKMMGGEMCIESEAEQGSEFYFTISLPIAAQEVETEEAESPVDAGILKGVRILLAEDNDLNAEIAIQLLEIQGAMVRRCENGRLAVEQFRESGQGEIQAILMDIQMPEMNGLEAARAIRALERPDAADVPIIAMTANSFQEDVDAAMEAGMNGFISKPLDVNYLYKLLHKVVNDRSRL